MKRRATINILLWIMAYMVVFLYRWKFALDGLELSTTVLSLLDLAVLYGCSQLINRILVPIWLHRKRSLLFIGALTAVFITASFVAQGLQLFWYKHILHSLNAQTELVFYTFGFQIFNTYIVQCLGCVCMCAYRLLNDYWITQNNYESLQKEKAQTELDFLKAQINPHFLFNSINSLYAEIDKTNTSARNIVLKFSEMLRYQLYECNVNAIAIEKEIDYLRNYVALERLRKEDHLNIHFELSGDLSGFEIAPLLLITFIENAFKYASNHEERENFIHILLKRHESHIHFECSNSKDRVLSRSLVEDHGIGINNVKRRLELLYPGRYRLNIRNEDDVFDVTLKIKLA